MAEKTGQLAGPAIMILSALIFGFFGFAYTWNTRGTGGEFVLFPALLGWTLKIRPGAHDHAVCPGRARAVRGVERVRVLAGAAGRPGRPRSHDLRRRQLRAMSRRKLVVSLVLLASGATASWFLWQGYGRDLMRGGVVRLEQWCGRQLQAIANDHLGPTLSFDTLDYEFPRTVTLMPVRLTADGVPFITADSIRVVFAEVPKVGSPVVIEAAVFDRPVVRLIEQADGSLLGFSGFVKTDGGQELADGGSTRLSDVLDITALEVTDGGLSYEPRDGPAMRLRPLTFALQHERPAPGDAEAEAGWYDFAARLLLRPVARLDVASRLNLDTAVLDIGSAMLTTSLTTAQYEVFTPEIQEILRQYQIVGDLEWSLSGQVPLRDTAATAIDTSLKLDDGSVSFGEYVLPARSIELSARLSEGVLDVHDWTVELLGGRAQLTFKVQAAGPEAGHFEAQGAGEGLRVERALKFAEGEETLRGSAGFHVRVQGSFEDLGNTFTGNGDLEVTEGHFTVVDIFNRVLGIGGRREDKDHGSGDFELTPDRVRWSDVRVSSNVIGIQGDGDLLYDGRLDLLVNVGPLKGRQEVLGLIGDAVGIVTDRLVAYHVAGTVQEPKVNVKPLSLGRDKKAEEVEETEELEEPDAGSGRRRRPLRPR
jgi:hypothetical protein